MVPFSITVWSLWQFDFKNKSETSIASLKVSSRGYDLDQTYLVLYHEKKTRHGLKP